MINLPNGGVWDETKKFMYQDALSQYYVLETLKMSLDKDPSVLRTGLAWRGKLGSFAYYNSLVRDSFIMTCDDWYEYTGGNGEDIIWYDLQHWKYAPGVNFYIIENNAE